MYKKNYKINSGYWRHSIKRKNRKIKNYIKI